MVTVDVEIELYMVVDWLFFHKWIKYSPNDFN